MENQFKKADTFLDGFIHYGQIQTLRNSKGVKTGETFNELGKLAFSEVNIRDTDNVTAFSLGYTINKKIKVPYRKIESNIKIKINTDDTVYDVVKQDTSDHKTLYLYLQISKNESEVISNE